MKPRDCAAAYRHGAATAGFAFFLLSACAIDNYGLLAANVTHADGAIVIDVYTVGGQLRTAAADPGLTIGGSKRSYVFARDAGESPAPGWHYFRVPLPGTLPVALDSRSLGLDIRSAAPNFDVALGYHETTVLTRAASDSNDAWQLSYRPFEPWLTRFQRCNEEFSC